ncbi:MAG: type I glyceraldehyde-3-phosphate dehydrogenase [Patescibacteria group bacterium]|nr:type I glyceraldehyde-3-phosphate dehydrogenase [Patescibacteria group bacterium]
MIKVAINGFGRIGRQAFKILTEKYGKKIEIVAINDLTENETLAHLLKFDSNYGTWDAKIDVHKNYLTINSKPVKVFSEKDPRKLPWKKLKIDVVLECTGFFTDAKRARSHLRAGAKRVIVSAPAKNHDCTIVLGVNEDTFDSQKDRIISCASCTTNGLAPVMKVLNDEFGVKRAFLTTVHSYTNDQRILDLPHEDIRRARAAAINLIPTKTGAAKAISEVLPELEGKMDGLAVRVPTSTVSLNDIVVELEKPTSPHDIMVAMFKASTGKMRGILKTADAELVSSDYKGSQYSSIFDGYLTKNIGDNFFKVFAWYDNEWGYSCRLADLAYFIGKKK